MPSRGKVHSGIAVLIASLVALAAPAKARDRGKLSAEVPSGVAPETRRQLFDGKSLRGWRGDNEQWSVREGAIVGRAATDRAAVLLSANRFGSFRLTFSARLAPGAEGAVCIWKRRSRAGKISLCPGIAFTFPEVGGWDGASHQNLAWKSVHPHPVKEPDSWVDVEILADVHTGRVRIAEDGVEVLDYIDPEPVGLLGGTLSFQVAAPPGASGEVQIKDILVDAAPRTGVLMTANLCAAQSPAAK
jgi:hypothetical protein